jgi:galactose mutarotase-like enzyme
VTAAAEVVRLRSSAMTVEVVPAHGMLIRSVRDEVSSLEALWSRPARAPRSLSPVLGTGGARSVESFGDVFVGGWFEMVPTVGYPAPEADAPELLHGEACRLPWTVLEVADDVLEARVQLLRSPFTVTRRIELGERLTIDTTLRNDGAHPAAYHWGSHPCFARATFAGGRIVAPVVEASVPTPPWDAANHALFPGTSVAWPAGVGRDGGELDLAAIPAAPTGWQDHVALQLSEGRFALATAGGRTFAVHYDLDALPYLLVWWDYGADAGWPLWGAGDVVALEPSSSPGRGLSEPGVRECLRLLDAGETCSHRIEAEWTNAE